MAGIQSFQKSTDSDSENKNNKKSENATKEKCQRLIDYAFGDGPYPVSDITGLPYVVKENVEKTIISEQADRKESVGEVVKVTLVHSADKIKLPTSQTEPPRVVKINQGNLNVPTERDKNLESVNIWPFWKEYDDKLLYFDPEKAESTAKEAPLKPEPTDMTDKSKNDHQSYEVEKTEEISKENQLKPSLDSGSSPDSTKNERSYDTEKIEVTAKKARLEQEHLHHFRGTEIIEMELQLDSFYKKDVAVRNTESTSHELSANDPKCTNEHESTPHPYSKKLKLLQPDNKKVKMISIDKEPYTTYNIHPEVVDAKIGNMLRSKSDAKFLEYIERFRVDPRSDPNGSNSKSKDDQSLLNAESKLSEATEAFRQAIMNRYMLKSTGDGLVLAQNMLIKATSEFCNKIKKDCAPSKMTLLYSTANKLHENKAGKLQADSKTKLKIASDISDIEQLDTNQNATRNVISTLMNTTNEKSDISFKARNTASTRNEFAKAANPTTLDNKSYLKMHVKPTETKILYRNTKQERKDKRYIAAAVANTVATREIRPKIKQIDHKIALVKVNKQSQKKDNAKIESFQDQATSLKIDSLLCCNTREAKTNEISMQHLSSTNSKGTNTNNQFKRHISDQQEESVNESMKKIIDTVLKKPKTQKVNKLEMDRAHETTSKSNETVQKDKHIFQPSYNNNWVQQFYSHKSNLPVTTLWTRVISTQEKDSAIKNKTNSSGKFPPIYLQSVAPSPKTETNKLNIPSPILSTNLNGLGETQNKTIQESEVALHNKEQEKVTARPNQRYQINNEIKKKIKQTGSRFVKQSELGDIELLLDKPKEYSEEKAYVLQCSSNKQKADTVRNPLEKTYIDMDKMPLSVLLKLVRSRNETKKARDAAMAVFGTKILDGIPNCPTSSDSQREKEGDESLYVPSYADQENKRDDALKTETQKQQDCKPESEGPQVEKCTPIKDIFNKPRKILINDSEPINSEGLIITEHINEYEPVFLRPKTISNLENIDDATTRQPLCPLPIRPIRNIPNKFVETLPNNGLLPRHHLKKEQDRDTPKSFTKNVWGNFHLNFIS